MKKKADEKMLKAYRELTMMHKKFELKNSMLTSVEEKFLGTVLRQVQLSGEKHKERRALVFDMMFQLRGVIDLQGTAHCLKVVDWDTGKLLEGVGFECPEPAAGSDQFGSFVDGLVRGVLSGKKFPKSHPCSYFTSPELYFVTASGAVIVHRAGCFFYGPGLNLLERHRAIRDLVGFELVA